MSCYNTCYDLCVIVPCIKNIIQGTSSCFEIIIGDEDCQPLDLDEYTQIKILIYDDYECNIKELNYTKESTDTTGDIGDIEILQEYIKDNYFKNKGKIRFCLNENDTKRGPSFIFIEIILKQESDETGNYTYTTESTDSDVKEVSHTKGLSGIKIARITESKFYQNSLKENENEN